MGALEDYIRSQRKIKDRNDPMRGSVMSRQSEPDPLAYSPEQDALEGSNPEDYVPNPKSIAALLAKAGAKLGGLGALGMVKVSTRPWYEKIAIDHPEIAKYIGRLKSTSNKGVEAGIVTVDNKPLGFIEGSEHSLEFPQHFMERSTNKPATYLHTHPNQGSIPSSWLYNPYGGGDLGQFERDLIKRGGQKEMMIVSPSDENLGSYLSLKADKVLPSDSLFEIRDAIGRMNQPMSRLHPDLPVDTLGRREAATMMYLRDLGNKDAIDLEYNLGSEGKYNQNANDWLDTLYNYYADKGIVSKDRYAEGGLVQMKQSLRDRSKEECRCG